MQARCRSRAPVAWFVAQKPPAEAAVAVGGALGADPLVRHVDAAPLGEALGLALHVHRDSRRP